MWVLIPYWGPHFWLQKGKGLREGQVLGVPVSAVWCKQGAGTWLGVMTHVLRPHLCQCVAWASPLLPRSLIQYVQSGSLWLHSNIVWFPHPQSLEAIQTNCPTRLTSLKADICRCLDFKGAAGNCTQYFVITYNKKDLKKNIYVYNWITLLYTWN